MTEKCFEERFRDVEENYKAITNRIAEAAVRSGRKPEDITFLAATKTVPAEVINHAIGCGLRFIGENRVQEFMDKYEKIDWDKGVSGQIIERVPHFLKLLYNACHILYLHFLHNRVGQRV